MSTFTADNFQLAHCPFKSAASENKWLCVVHMHIDYTHTHTHCGAMCRARKCSRLLTDWRPVVHNASLGEQRGRPKQNEPAMSNVSADQTDSDWSRVLGQGQTWGIVFICETCSRVGQCSCRTDPFDEPQSMCSLVGGHVAVLWSQICWCALMKVGHTLLPVYFGTWVSCSVLETETKSQRGAAGYFDTLRWIRASQPVTIAILTYVPLSALLPSRLLPQPGRTVIMLIMAV